MLNTNWTLQWPVRKLPDPEPTILQIAERQLHAVELAHLDAESEAERACANERMLARRAARLHERVERLRAGLPLVGPMSAPGFGEQRDSIPF